MYDRLGLRGDGIDVFAVNTNSFRVLEAGFECCAGSSRHSTAGQQKRAVHQLPPNLREVRKKLKLASTAESEKPLLKTHRQLVRKHRAFVVMNLRKMRRKKREEVIALSIGGELNANRSDWAIYVRDECKIELSGKCTQHDLEIGIETYTSIANSWKI